MAANNTVEATLRSRFEDGVSRGIENTQKLMNSAFLAMKSAGAAASTALQGAVDALIVRVNEFQQRMRKASEESGSSFGKMGFAALAFAGVAAGAFIQAAQAIGGFVFGLAKEASQITELKLAYEGLTKTVGWHADTLQRLKTATEGLIGTTDLLKNVNRVMQSGVQINSDTYVKLTENIYKLAKASGADGTTAVNALTDALLRGSARGLQAVGIHLAVRDAVSDLAIMTGQHTSALRDNAKMQVFQRELLEATSSAAAKLPPDFLSIEDAINRVEKAWRGYLLAFGEAINRSGVFQELTRRLIGNLDELGTKKSQIEELTLATNTFLISTVRGIAQLIDLITFFGPVWAGLYAGLQGVAGAIGYMFSLAAGLVAHFVGRVIELVGLLPGAAGKAARGMVEQLAVFRDGLLYMRGEFAAAMSGAFDEKHFGSNIVKLEGWSAAAKKLAGDLEAFRGKVIEGEEGAAGFGDATDGAARATKQLNEQITKYNELRRELAGRNATPERQALLQLLKDYEQIGQLTLVGEERRNQLRLQAVRDYNAKVSEITEKRATEEAKLQEEADAAVSAGIREQLKAHIADTMAMLAQLTGAAARETDRWLAEMAAKAAKQREEERQKQVAQVIATAGAIERAIDMSRRGKLAPEVGLDAMQNLPRVIADTRRQIEQLQRMKVLDERQLDDLTKLQVKLEELQRINWTPFRRAMQTMRDEVRSFAARGTEAFGAFFADIVSGQEGAGKKLLAAFMGMIGQMLVHIGVILVQSGIAEIALAQTLVGRLMGASVAAGIKAIAVGALLAAAGGIMQGAASGLAQTNQSNAGGSFQQDVPRPTSSSQVPIYMVGTPRGAQTPGQAAAAPAVPILLRVEVAPPKGWVANEVVREVKGNNQQLRVVLANA